jgi:D-sorbitol dehydrogenase (acceptor)
MRFSGRVGVVTGGARGIGRAIAERYACEGMQVAIADLRHDEAKAVSREIGRGAFAVELDVTRQESIDLMVERVVAEAGQIDVLVNSAGIFSMLPLLDITRDSFANVFAVNVEGLLFTLQAVARQMVRQGRGGKIINLASQAGRRGEPLVAVYCASKAAVISLTQSAGLALIKHRINVNAIAPGVIDTPMYDEVDALCAKYMNIPVGENKRQVAAGVPYGRMGRPEELAGMAAFLASDDADYIVAQTYGVDGGNWMA